MKYIFATKKENYADFAAGRVILAKTGTTSFPVRLASEIFQRCAAYLPADQQLRVYDPCCGGGYLLTVIGFLHKQRIRLLLGSDIHFESVLLAQRNLALLTASGLASRQFQIKQMLDNYNKSAHLEALQSIERLAAYLPEQTIMHETWLADAMKASLAYACVDILMSDIPYGDLVSWQGELSDNPVYDLLQSQYEVLASGGIAAIISDTKQKTAPPGYQRLLRDKLGKRHILLLQKG